MRGRLAVPGYAALLFLLNAVVCRRLFSMEFTTHMESTEGAFIALSRYAMRNWGHLDWLPIWFTGMPFSNVYQPGYHLSVAALATAANWTPQHAYHFVSALVYCLGPVTLFLLAYYFTRSPLTAFSTGLLYSVISPSCLLIPEIRADTGGWFAYRRYLNVIKYADTPHLAAVMLVPLALILIDLAAVKRRKWAIPLAAVAIASIVLTNWPGTVGFAFALLGYVLARKGIHWPTFIAAGVLGYLIASPWVPPSTLISVQRNAQQSDWMAFGGSQVVYGLALAAMLAGLYWWFRRSHLPEWDCFAIYLAVITGAVVVSRYWFHFQFFPQPHRWHVEMEIGIVAACAARVRKPIWLIIPALCFYNVVRYADSLTNPIDVTETTEYRISKWFGAHMPGERVFVPGSVSMWMNNFTDNPQLAGCCDQGVPSYMHRVALYIVYTGQNAGDQYVPIITMWLQAYGVHAIAVTGPNSGEMFHPYTYPEKFKGALTELWRENDDAIYEVPHTGNSLAHAISPTDVVTREPVHGLDIEPLRPYVNAVQKSALPFHWLGTASARIDAALHKDQLVALQVTYDPAWIATVNGSPRPITRDALDLMVIHPNCEGACTIRLEYRPHSLL